MSAKIQHDLASMIQANYSSKLPIVLNRELDNNQNDLNKKTSYRTQSMKMTLSALHPKRCCKLFINLRRNLSTSSPSPHNQFASMDDSSLSSIDTNTGLRRRRKISENKNKISCFNFSKNINTVSILDLFKYANFRERFALGVGCLCMLYTSSWQPISVFILATMATLMGQFSSRIELLNEMACHANQSIHSNQVSSIGEPRAFISGSNDELKNDNENNFNHHSSSNLVSSIFSSLLQSDIDKPRMKSLALLNEFKQNLTGSRIGKDDTSSTIRLHAIQPTTSTITQSMEKLISEPYESHQSANIPILEPISKLITPILWPTRSQAEHDGENIQSAVANLYELEERQFLRSSFELNGSAFMLAQTQLLSFFIGLSLISWAARQQASRVKCLFFKSCLQQELNWFESRPDDAAGMGSSLNTLVGKYEDGIGVKLALLIYFIGHIILFAFVAFWQMANLAAFCMPFVLLVWLVIVYLSNFQSIAIGESSMFAKRSLQLAEEIIGSIRTVFAFNGQKVEMKRFEEVQEPVYRKSLVKHFYTALNTSLSKFSIFACFSLYCFYASRLFPPYNSDGPSNRASVLAVMRGAEVSIVNILISIPFMEALQQSRGCIAGIYQIIERKSRINPTSNQQELDETGSSLEWDGSLCLKHVQFTYSLRPQLAHFRRRASKRTDTGDDQGSDLTTNPDRDGAREDNVKGKNKKQPMTIGQKFIHGGATMPATDKKTEVSEQLARQVRSLSDADRDALLGSQQRILSGVSLDISAGQSVALVGPSGSGKSTILSLVQRLYDVTEGRLLIGRRDIRTLPPGWLRNQIGVVTQEPRLFDLTISENIRLGLSREQEAEWDESFIQQQVIEAATKAGAHQFIVQLPMSYETRVGGSGGVQLSGGQRQRIAIARALIRRPKLLLLDECTSALDSESEAQVQAALRAASAGKTTLIVAHHLSTIKHCDMIVVMERGRVVERGSHKELINAFGLYRRLWDEQSRHRNEPDTSGNGSGSSATGSSTEATTSSDSSALTSPSNSMDLGRHATSPLVGKTGLSNNANYFELETGSDKTQQHDKRSHSPSVCNRFNQQCLDVAEETEDPEDGIGDLTGASAYKTRSSRNHNTSRNSGGAKHKGKNLANRDSFSIQTGNAKQHKSSSIASSISRLESVVSKVSDGESMADSHYRVATPGFSRLWRFIELPKWSSVAAVFACLFAGLILPMNLIAHSYLFAAFAYKNNEQLGQYIYAFGIWVLSFSAIVFVVSVAQIILPGYVGERLSKKMRIKIMNSLLVKPIFYFDLQMNSAGALVDRFNSHISNIQSIAGSRVATLLESCSTLVASGLFGFALSPSLSLFCLMFALLVLCTTMLESRLSQLECERERQFDVQAANLMADALSNIRTITSLNGESFFIKRFSNIMVNRKRSHARSLVYLRTFLTSLKFVMPAMSWSASMYFGSVLLVDGKIDLQTVFIVCPVVLFAVNDTFRALVFLPELMKAKTSVSHLYQMHEEFSPQLLQTLTLSEQLLEQSSIVAATTNEPLDTNNNNSKFGDLIPTKNGQLPTGKQARSMSIFSTSNRRLSTLDSLPNYMNPGRRTSLLNSVIPLMPTRGRLEFRSVDFAYPNRPSQLILENFTLSIAPGECVALVGGSGSGKSTTVALLEKFYDYHCGQVTLDGHDLRLVQADWVRSQIGLVQQEPTLFSCSIAENIRYGDNSRYVPMDQIVEAARAANIHDFIMSLPDQYDTQLSGGSGSRLSGGQRQRIAIARAIVRRAPILIFDEATSALDTQNETYVQEALKRSRRGRTSLIIAHRLATIKDADKIVVMRNGRIVEIGTHFELLRMQNGQYKSLWQRQEAENWSGIN